MLFVVVERWLFSLKLFLLLCRVINIRFRRQNEIARIIWPESVSTTMQFFFLTLTKQMRYFSFVKYFHISFGLNRLEMLCTHTELLCVCTFEIASCVCVFILLFFFCSLFVFGRHNLEFIQTHTHTNIYTYNVRMRGALAWHIEQQKNVYASCQWVLCKC